MTNEQIAEEILGVLCNSEFHNPALALKETLEKFVNLVIPDEPHPEPSQFWDDEAERDWQNHQYIRRKLLDVCDELEAK